MKYRNTKEAAAYLGLKPSTLEQWRYLGIGPEFRRHGRLVFYSESALDAFSDQRVCKTNAS